MEFHLVGGKGDALLKIVGLQLEKEREKKNKVTPITKKHDP